MATFRDMTSHRLQPLRHFYQGAHLVVNAVPDAAQAALMTGGYIPAGRCMHLNPATKYGQLPGSKLGCAGNNKIPVWLFRDSDAYSGGFPGDNVATSTAPVWADGSTGQLLHFVGLEGFELATSEFQKARDYTIGDYLKAPEYDNSGATHANNTAGIVTNDTVRWGTETIVGIVAPGEWAPYGLRSSGSNDQVLDPDGTKMLAFYTTYRPGLQHVPSSVVV